MLVLYKDDTTSFSNLGLGVLKDLRSDALITEELNGSLILEFEYIKKGHLSDSLVEGNLIKCNNQIFRIKNINKSLSDSESIKILAQQYFQFDMSKNFLADVAPTKLNGTNALKWIVDKAETKTNFVIGGDCTNVSSARYVRKNVSDAIYSADNSLLTRFGGELEFNLNNVYLKNKRGSDKGFSIRYRKNLKGLEFNLDFSTVATKICPQGSNELLLDDLYVSSPKINNYYQPFFKKVEFNDIGVDEETTEEQAKNLLKNAALELFDAGIDVPEISIKVDFVELSKCIEYKEYQNLETCSLGDTIKVIIPEFSINTSVRVVKTIYNDNLERLTYLELGTVAKNIVSSNASSIKDIKNTIENPKSILDSAKKNATELINHPFKGNLYIDDKTGVLYLMDTNDINTAKNVWKWSMGGLGFSSNGINGTFNTAITQNGEIVADFITTGKINTDLIEGYSNLELAVQNSLLSITPQYCIEGTDNWSDTIPTTETWQKILTRNKYVATNGKITYSKVIPYVEGMNNLINSIEGIDVSIYNSNDEEMGLESIVLDGRCTQETSTQSKNLFDGVMESGGINNTTGNNQEKSSLLRSKNYVSVKPNTTYIISNNGVGVAMNVLEYASDKSFISFAGVITAGKPFTTSSTTHYIRFYRSNSNADKIQVEAGNTITNWVAFTPNMPSPDYPSEVECVKSKNLLPNNATSQVLNGITFTVNSDKTITANGTSMAVTDLYMVGSSTEYVDLGLSTGSYTLKGCPAGGSAASYMLYAVQKRGDKLSYYQEIGNGLTINVEAGDTFRIFIRILSGKTVSNILYKPMLSKNGGNYIPYGNIQIVEIGKNLFDEDGAKEIDNYNISLSNNYKGIKIWLKPNTKYSISRILDSSLSADAGYNLQFVKEDKSTPFFYLNNYVYSQNVINGTATFTTGNTGVIYLATLYGNDTRLSTYFSNVKVQLEEGETVTSYAPYQLQKLNVDLQGNKLCSKSDVKDKLIIKNGRAKILKKIGEIVVKEVGNAYSINSDMPNTTYVKIYSILKDNPSASSKVALPMSNYLPGKHIYAIDQIGIYTDSSDVAFRLPKAIGTTIKEINAWLSTHNLIIYYVLAQEKEIDLGEVDNINLFTEDNNILNSESANMKIGYYTDYTFYKTVMEQYAKIDLNNDNINIELAKKTNSKNIIATINMSTEKDDEGSLIQINSDKLNIKNKVFNLQSDEIEIESPNFSVSKEGKINAKSGLIGGFSLDDISFHTHIEDPYTYTIADATRVLEIANGSTATEEEMKKYDVNEDGVIDRLDYTIILRKIYGYEATSGDFYILANNPRYMIKTSSNGLKVKPTKIGLSMISTTNFYGCSGSFTSFDDNTSQTVIDGGQINCVALTQTSLEQHKKNIEKFSNALEEIKKTDIYRYNMKSESDDKKKHLGFVIGKNFNYSHLITAENEKGKEIGVDNYSMISLCLQAIKEQQVIIEKLEIKINTLMKGIK